MNDVDKPIFEELAIDWQHNFILLIIVLRLLIKNLRMLINRHNFLKYTIVYRITWINKRKYNDCI